MVFSIAIVVKATEVGLMGCHWLLQPFSTPSCDSGGSMVCPEPRQEKGLGSKVTQFISYLVVAKDNDTACFALKCMSNAKLLEAPITTWSEVRMSSVVHLSSKTSRNSGAESSVPLTPSLLGLIVSKNDIIEHANGMVRRRPDICRFGK
jgi:hypothetical protein